jgi:integrase/recombinase XerD
MEHLKQWETKHSKYIGKTYKNDIKQFLETARFDPLKPSYNAIVKHVAYIRKREDNPKVVKNKLLAIKKYYSCLLDLKIIKNHPCRHLKLYDKIDRNLAIETFFSDAELQCFLQRELQSIPALRLRNKIIRQLLVYQAFTVHEIVNLELQDIDFKTCKISIKNSRTLHLEAPQLLPLNNYITKDRTLLKKAGETDVLLLTKNGNKIPSETISETINYKAKKRFTPRIIRQSVIYNLLKNGNDLRQVQLFAGHKYISSTEKYLSNNLTELRTELEKKHPL